MIALRRSGIAHAFSWIAALAFVTAFAIAAGCGGSGSSGFDLAEIAAIERVTSDQECEEFDGLLICPADAAALPTPTAPPDPTGMATLAPTEIPTRSSTPEPTVFPQATPTPPASTTLTVTPVDSLSPTPLPATATPSAVATATPSPTPSPTAIASPGVITQVGDSNDVQTCETSGAHTCTLRFAFTPIGFPPDAAFRVASRLVGAETAWRIDDPTPAGPAGAPFSYAAPLEVDLATSTAGLPSQQSLQVVVLAFESDPGPVPEMVNLLSDTGADVAFAVVPFEIVVE